MQTSKQYPVGIIEGFFGRPWQWSTRLSAVDFMAECGFQFYVYAPKADAFLRRRWREPLPPDTMMQLSTLKARSASKGIAMGVGLSPYELYLNYDAHAKSVLRAKVSQLNEIEIDMLCILFDDMRGDFEGLCAMQSAITHDICTWSTAGRFIVCPTYYSYDARLTREFGPPPKTYLRDFGRSIDPRVDIFWTGDKVISNGYTARHLAEVAADMGRSPFIWDNSISNDSKVRTNFLYLDPGASGWALAAELTAGVAFNPMNQFYLSQIALRDIIRIAREGPRFGSVDALAAYTSLYGQTLGAQLFNDRAVFHTVGLAGLDADVRLHLLDRYCDLDHHPAAREVAAWLRNEYAFDPQCLTS